jgi:hypothetical protein
VIKESTMKAQTVARSAPYRPVTSNAGRLLKRAVAAGQYTRIRLHARLPERADDRGDVPGWVLVTLMTAGLVLTLWAVAGPRLEEVFNDAMDRVVGGP